MQDPLVSFEKRVRDMQLTRLCRWPGIKKPGAWPGIAWEVP